MRKLTILASLILLLVANQLQAQQANNNSSDVKQTQDDATKGMQMPQAGEDANSRGMQVQKNGDTGAKDFSKQQPDSTVEHTKTRAEIMRELERSERNSYHAPTGFAGYHSAQ